MNSTPLREAKGLLERFHPVLLTLVGIFLAAWVGAFGKGPLVVGTLLYGVVLLATYFRSRGAGGWRWGVPVGGLGIAVLLAWGAELHLSHLSRTWEERAQARELQVREQLGRELDSVLLAGEDAVARLVSRWQADGEGPGRSLAVRLPRGVDALALFGPAGELLEWYGEHLGPVPREARLGLNPYLFKESALFSYLYVVRSLPDGSGTAMEATLLRANLPASLDDARGDVVSRFFSRTGARIQLGGEERILGPVAWALTWERDILFSVGVIPAQESEIRDQLLRRWKLLVAIFLLAFWGVLAHRVRQASAAVIWIGPLLLAMAVLFPLGIPGVGPRLFAPADFLLPGPFPLSLGQILLLAMAGLVLTAFHDPEARPQGRVRWLFGFFPFLGLGVLFGTAAIMVRGASLDLLAGAEVLWMAFVGTTVLLVILSWRLLLFGVSIRAWHPLDWVWPWIALVLSLGMAVVGALWVQLKGPMPLEFLAFWIFPLLLLGRGWVGNGVPQLRWVLLVVMASSALFPWGWGARVEAKMALGEDRVSRLGIQPDPFVEYLLLRAGEEARDLSRMERSPLEILYGAWTRSGLATEGVPLWLAWTDPEGRVQEEFQVGVMGGRPPHPGVRPMGTVADGEVSLARFGIGDQHYRMEAPLQDGARITVVVPPRLGFEEAAPLGPLFSPARSETDPVSLLPVLVAEGELEDGASPPLVWRRGLGAWIGETLLTLPDQGYRVRYRIPLPGPLLMMARGFLFFLGGILTVGTLVFLGRSLRTPQVLYPRGIPAQLRSFQGRLTLALFAFFVLPASLFGLLAYQTLAATSVRTAETLAARAAEEAAAAMDPGSGIPVSLASVAAGVGSDLLLYRGGQLVEGSRRELVALGLYPGWIPPAVAQAMTQGGEVLVTAPAALGGWDYVVAFRRLAGDGVLAAPAALQAGATAVRQREVAELLIFALVLGAVLSLLLSLLVGRTLARPIQTLQIASERVGAGNLRVHLPEERQDEFGSVFAAFNRMVDQRARAQRALIRGSRRTRTIVEEVATGVVAVDPQGRIVLANPRAEVLLGRSLARRMPLSEALRSDEESSLGGLTEWVQGFLDGEDEESREEFTLNDRRLRGRVRRIGGGRGRTGAVVALEDVTDALRTERILAWGEMAQQVAHEVKNPLTPMKLGIQHIQRAWSDGHPDFDQILARNAQAILTEIERLAQVSSSFASFVAPVAGTDRPLEPVHLPRVLNEVLDLYAAGSGALTFRSFLPDDLPPVQARSDEFKEVLFNLFENARAALAGEGQVEVRCLEIAKTEIHLVVIDNGPGIPRQLLPRLFEPYFSTRATGTGLGLAIVHRLVTSWAGTVVVESTEGEGTQVHLRLGRSDAASNEVHGAGQSAIGS
jgi:signal transduction histidine kinase